MLRSKQPTEQPRTLAPDEHLAPVLSLCKVSVRLYQDLVREHLGAGLPTFNRRPSGLALALMSGSAIVGLIHYELTWRWNADRDEASLKLDLAVPTNVYKHLAKLVLRAALSREVRQMVEALYKRRVRRAVTTAFSQHPESMKYRGLFKQTLREKLEDGRYRLRYSGDFTNMTLEEHYAEWLTVEGLPYEVGYRYADGHKVYLCTAAGLDAYRRDAKQERIPLAEQFGAGKL